MTTEPDIRAAAGAAYPPGPPFWPRLLTGKLFNQDPVRVMRENARQYGDMVHFKGLEGHVYQFNHPVLIQELLVELERRNRRTAVMQRARALLGDGLLTSEEPLHMRQRRMAAPAFHRARIAAYGDVIGQFAAEMTGSWAPGVMKMHPQVLLLALRIVGKCMFGLDAEQEVEKITDAVSAFMRPLPGWIPKQVLDGLQKIPFGPMLRVQQGINRLDAILYAMIAERRQSGEDRGDLLSMMLAAVDTEGDSDNNRMSDKQLRDECLTVLLAGHETTANAMSFALWLLATHPEIQEEASAEAVRVLGGRPHAEAADYGELKHAYGIFAEAMRLYPTVWVMGRNSGPEPYKFRGFTIQPGAILLAPQIVVHRDPRFWQEPDRFDPSRFPDEKKNGRPKYAYFPFGGGSRQCIGEGLAWMEGTLAIATTVRAWRLKPAPDEPKELPMNAQINLRPATGVPLLLERR